ncbi:MAG TPA: hypothetical protein DEF05_03595 [Erwinia sp.]|nr:hypothetical protein [Erwinia sp.]
MITVCIVNMKKLLRVTIKLCGMFHTRTSGLWLACRPATLSAVYKFGYFKNCLHKEGLKINQDGKWLQKACYTSAVMIPGCDWPGVKGVIFRDG